MSKEIVNRAAKTDLTSMEGQMANDAAKIQSLITVSGGPRISLNRNGNFVAPDGLELGASIRGVVVDFIFKNQFYTSAYDPNNPAPPVCVAMATLDGFPDMAPDSSSPEPQNEDCATCWANQWESRGRGKACKNTYELAFILDENLDDESPKLYQVSVPPTGMGSFSAFLKLCARVLNSGPVKSIVSINAVPKGSYTTMSFGDPDNNPNFEAHAEHREEARAMLLTPPDFSNYKPTKKPSASRGPIAPTR